MEETLSDDDNAVTIDDLKKVTPMEENAQTTIIETIDQQQTSGEHDPLVETSMSRAVNNSLGRSVISNEEGGNRKMKNAALKILRMQRMAQAVQVSESSRSDDVDNHQQSRLRLMESDRKKKLLQPEVIEGAMGKTTNAMVANANILLQRKQSNKKLTTSLQQLQQQQEDLENGGNKDPNNNNSSIHSKKSDTPSSNPNSRHNTKLGKYIPEVDVTQSREEMKQIYKGLKPEANRIWQMFKMTFVFGVILFLAAFILFYTVDLEDVCVSFETYDPPTHSPTIAVDAGMVNVTDPSATPAPTPTPEPIDYILLKDCTTISWICLFLLRHIVTFYLALLAQLVIVDVICLQFQWVTRWMGPLTVLGIIQAKGWPLVLFLWSLFNFGMCYGQARFVKHWLFWVGWGLFNEDNPAGNLTNSVEYRNVLFSMLCLGIAAAIKRVWFGLLFGKRTYKTFHEQLTDVMEQVILISEVAHLGKQIEMNLIRDANYFGAAGRSSINSNPLSFQMHWTNHYYASVVTSEELSMVESLMNSSIDGDDEDVGLEREDLTVSQRHQINTVVGEWEEPQIPSHDDSEEATLEDIISFSQTLVLINNNFPFTTSFGKARTRELCLKSAQILFQRLQEHGHGTKPNSIPFDTIAMVAKTKSDDNSPMNRSSLDEAHVKRLLRAFRPDRDGNLTLLDFVKSVDNAYKKLRLLQASILNNSQIDNAAERMYNVAFYLAYCFIFQAGILGMTFISTFIMLLFGVVAPLSFALSNACGKYVEGVLLVLVRKPYGIGDRIALSDVSKDTSKTGSVTWFVTHVDLFTTTVRFSCTNEVATLANSSLAPCRIINANRSPRAAIRITLRFGVDVPVDKVDAFYLDIEDYVKQRPREFFQLNGLFASTIAVEKGYVEYILSVQHLESWQNMGSVWKSKVDLTQHCHNLSRKLDMRFINPMLPVDIVKITHKGGQEAMSGVDAAIADAIRDSTRGDDDEPANVVVATGVPVVQTVVGGADGDNSSDEEEAVQETV